MNICWKIWNGRAVTPARCKPWPGRDLIRLSLNENKVLGVRWSAHPRQAWIIEPDRLPLSRRILTRQRLNNLSPLLCDGLHLWLYMNLTWHFRNPWYGRTSELNADLENALLSRSRTPAGFQVSASSTAVSLFIKRERFTSPWSLDILLRSLAWLMNEKVNKVITRRNAVRLHSKLTHTTEFYRNGQELKVLLSTHRGVYIWWVNKFLGDHTNCYWRNYHNQSFLTNSGFKREDKCKQGCKKRLFVNLKDVLAAE